MKKLLLFISATIILAGCSPEDLFSMLAQSEIEQAAGENIKAADETTLEFEAIIKDKTAAFDNTASLNSDGEDGSYGVAFVSPPSSNTEYTHEVWALLPPLEEEGSFYEGWLVEPGSEKFVSTGPMQTSENGKTRFITFFSNVDFSSYTKVVITKELVRDKIPETHVLEGEFTKEE